MGKPRGGLTAWFGKGPKGDWVNIGAPKKDGKFQPCGRKTSKKGKYPKCVPRATANRMSAAEIRSAVRRKRAAGNPGGKPTNVKTFAKRKKAADGMYMGRMIDADLGGVKVSNPSYKKYYQGMI